MMLDRPSITLTYRSSGWCAFAWHNEDDWIAIEARPTPEEALAEVMRAIAESWLDDPSDGE